MVKPVYWSTNWYSRVVDLTESVLTPIRAKSSRKYQSFKWGIIAWFNSISLIEITATNPTNESSIDWTHGLGTLCQAATLLFDASGWSCGSSTILSNPLSTASIAIFRGLVPFPVLDGWAGWDPPSPATEAMRALAGWRVGPASSDDGCSDSSEAKWSQASSSLSSAWAGAVARPKKNLPSCPSSSVTTIRSL